MSKKILYFLTIGFTGLMFACTPEDIYDEKFDIKYKVAKISGFSPDTALIGQEIELIGENFDDDSLKVFIGADSMSIVAGSVTPNRVKVIVPRKALTSKIKVLTFFSGNANTNPFSPKDFVVKYPATEITSVPDTLFLTQPFTIKGKNLDLITGVAIGDSLFPYTNTNEIAATFDFKTFPSTSSIVALNFVTRNKDNFTDRQIVVMPDLPKIAILAQFPDSASEGDLMQLVFDRPDFGKFMYKVTVEYAIDATAKKPTTKNFTVTDLKIASNKMFFTLPDAAFLNTVGAKAALTGVIRISGAYKFSLKQTIVLK